MYRAYINQSINSVTFSSGFYSGKISRTVCGEPHCVWRADITSEHSELSWQVLCWDCDEAEYRQRGNIRQCCLPSSACLSHSTKGFSRSRRTAFPLPSLYHFKIASSLNTSAANNNRMQKGDQQRVDNSADNQHVRQIFHTYTNVWHNIWNNSQFKLIRNYIGFLKN